VFKRSWQKHSLRSVLAGSARKNRRLGGRLRLLVDSQYRARGAR
jgi:hypothetical protein